MAWVVWQLTEDDVPGQAANGGPSDRAWSVLRPRVYLERSVIAERSGLTERQAKDALGWLIKRGRVESARIGKAHGYRRRG